MMVVVIHLVRRGERGKNKQIKLLNASTLSPPPPHLEKPRYALKNPFRLDKGNRPR